MKSKSIKAWGTKDKKGKICRITFSNKGDAKLNADMYDEEVIPVEIKEIKNARK